MTNCDDGKLRETLWAAIVMEVGVEIFEFNWSRCAKEEDGFLKKKKIKCCLQLVGSNFHIQVRYSLFLSFLLSQFVRTCSTHFENSVSIPS